MKKIIRERSPEEMSPTWATPGKTEPLWEMCKNAKCSRKKDRALYSLTGVRIQEKASQQTKEYSIDNYATTREGEL